MVLHINRSSWQCSFLAEAKISALNNWGLGWRNTLGNERRLKTLWVDVSLRAYSAWKSEGWSLQAAVNLAGTGLCRSTVTTERSSPYCGGLTATGVCNEEAISPKCWLLTSKKVIKIIVCIIEPVSRFILELCKQSFSLGSSLCPRIILELKNTLCFVTLLPLPWHCFWGVLRLPHLMLRAKFAGGDVRGLLVLFFFWWCFWVCFWEGVNCNLLQFSPTLVGERTSLPSTTSRSQRLRDGYRQTRWVFRAGISRIRRERRSHLLTAVVTTGGMQRSISASTGTVISIPEAQFCALSRLPVYAVPEDQSYMKYELVTKQRIQPGWRSLPGMSPRVKPPTSSFSDPEEESGSSGL